jgi:hypothetical protein
MGLLRTAAGGALGGFLATIPMTAVMVAGQRAAGYGRLPPEALVTNAIDDAESLEDLDDVEVEATWRAAHLAAGAAFGVAYSLLFRPLTRILPRPLSGALFALLVWRISYQNVAPALELMPPADSDDEARQKTNVAAHLVYGATLGWLTGRLR